MSKKCYVPIKGIDAAIAYRLNWSYTTEDGRRVASQYRVANLRAMYEEETGKELDLDDLDKTVEILRQYAKKLIILNNESIKTSVSNMQKSWKILRRAMPIEERNDRVSMVASYFSLVLDEYCKNNPGIPRQAFLEGFTHNGIHYGGEAAIFNGVYNKLLENRARYYAASKYEGHDDYTKEKNLKKFEALNRMLARDVYPSLVAMARHTLRDTEGNILGQKYEYSAAADLENFRDDELDEAWDASEAKREGWMEKTDETSAFGSIGLQVRRFLSTVPKMVLEESEETNDILDGKREPKAVYERDDLGIVRYNDAAFLHSQLVELLIGVQNEDDMLDMLTEDGKPKQIWLTPIVEKLRTDHLLRTQFFVDFKKGFQPYSMSFIDKEMSRKTGASYHKTKLINRVTNLLRGDYILRITRGKKLSEKSIFSDSTLVSKGYVNWQNLADLRDEVRKWTKETPTTNILASSDAKLLQKGPNAPKKSEKVHFLMEVFSAMGIEARISTIEKIVSSNDIYKVREILSEYFDVQVGIDPGAKASGISLVIKGNNATLWNKGEYSKMSDVHMIDFYNEKHKPDDNEPKIKEHTEKLLNIVTKNQDGLRLESRGRYMDKNMFSTVAPNFMSDRLDAIKAYVRTNHKDGLKAYLLSEYCDTPFMAKKNGQLRPTIYNYWIDELIKCCETPDNIRLEDTFAGNFDYIRNLGSDVQEFENFTSKTHAIDMINHFFSDERQNKSFITATEPDSRGRRFKQRMMSALYPVFILGDSGVCKYMRGPRIRKDGKNKNEWGSESKKEIIDHLFNVYKQELIRMNLVNRMNEKLRSKGYKEVHSTDKFSTLVFLNEDKWKDALGDKPSDSDVKAVIEQYMNEATQAFINRLDEFGVTERKTDKEGKPLDILANLNQLGTPQTVNEKLEEFFWNTKLATIQQFQIMTVDPSFYKNTKDLQKRYKEIHAPGSAVSLLARNPFKPGNPYYNPIVNGKSDPERAVYIDDLELSFKTKDSGFEAAIMSNKRTKGFIDKYRKSSLTDGQGWRTLSSYRKVMGMAGKWTQDMEDVYDMVMELRAKYGERVPKRGEDGFADYTSRIAAIAEKAVVLQPIKPYMFTHEMFAINSIDKVLIPVQHKYSEAVLIPELLPEGSQIRDMAYWMDNHTDEKGNPAPIDLICATSVVKVGSFGSTSVKGLSDRNSFYNALNAGYVHELDYKDYRIQTNVPEHMNSSQLFGTQVRKLIMSGLRLGGKYNYLKNLRKSPKTINLGGRWKNVNAQELSGRNLLALYNSLIMANILESYEEFEQTFGNIHRLSDVLMQSVLSNSRESMDNLLSYAVTGNADFLMPLFEGGLEHDSAAMLLSLFKKKVNKQTIKGGSAVQVSAFGITGYEQDGDLSYVVDPDNPNNILYAECEIPFNLSFYDARTKDEVKLDFDVYCKQDGTLKLGKPLKKDDPEYNKYLSYKNENGEVCKPLIEEDYPDILSIIAYRIPTERAYSMINLKVKRFSRMTAGGTIKVPLQGTVISGFDFDIDKLYFMMREYRTINHYDEKYFSTEDRNKIFGKIYEEHPDIKKALMNARDRKDPMSVTYLNKFWKEAKIEERFGYNKNELFEETARKLGMTPNTVINEKFEEYDFEKTPEDNTRASRNNLLIDLMQARLSDYETFAERYTPGGFVNASSAARKLRELIFGSLKGVTRANLNDTVNERTKDPDSDPEPNYDPTDPMTIITYNQQNQVAGKLIGIYANQNTHHAFASLMHAFIVNDGSEIEFCGHSYRTDGVGKDFINPPHRADGMNDVDLYVAELLAASVDAVKDPVLNFLNLNTVTADSGAVLVRLGYSFEEVGLLFNHPVIKQLCADCFNGNIHVSSALTNLIDRLSDSASSDDPKINISKELLMESIVNDRVDRENGNYNYMFKHADESLAVLNLFRRIQEVADNVGTFITNTKFTASNAVSATFGGMYAQQMRVDDYMRNFSKDEKSGLFKCGRVSMKVVMGNDVLDEVNTPITNRKDLLTMSKADYMDTMRMNPFAFEQCMYDMNRKAIELLAPTEKSKKGYYPYGRPMYENARNSLRRTIEYSLDDETIDALHRDIPVFLLANETDSEFCGERESKDERYSNRQYYTKVFVDDLLYMLEAYPELKELAIFQYLRPEEVLDENGELERFDLLLQDVGGLHPQAKEEIKESWASLVDMDKDGNYINEDNAKLAVDLFKYCFYKLGYDFSYATFMDLAPTAVKEAVVVSRRRNHNINTFTEVNPDSNDVFVFNPSATYFRQTALDDFGFLSGVNEGMRGKAYALPHDEDGVIDLDAFRRLCSFARQNPEYTFKIQNYLDQEDVDSLAHSDIDIPINIQFSEDTLTENSWDDVSYGKNISYVDFLNEILDGTNNSMDIQMFIKQYLLNHLDNWRFVTNTNNPSLKEWAESLKYERLKKPKESLDIDAMKMDSSIRGQIVNIQYNNGEVISAKWKPVLKIGDYYYMASGPEWFNENKSTSMKYVLVSPFGMKGKSKMYHSGPEVNDIQEYVYDGDLNDQPELSSPITESPSDPPSNFNRDAAIKSIENTLLNHFINTVYIDAAMGIRISSEGARQMVDKALVEMNMGAMSDAELEAHVEKQKENARLQGITFYDENGNPVESC